MSKKYAIGIMIFRRDLRLYDNTALNNARVHCQTVIPVFIFDPRQVGDDNEYRSKNALQFMVTSINELADAIAKKDGRLSICYGNPDAVVRDLLKESSAQAVFCNYDYTPFSIERDSSIEKVCHKNNADFIQTHDALLFAPGTIVTGSGTPYTIFTPFYKATLRHQINAPERCASGRFSNKKLDVENHTILKTLRRIDNPNVLLAGGRKEALALLKKINMFTNYQHEHDIPSIETTHLSAHHKFGTISIRESYTTIAEVLGKGHPLLRQLIWRDFFYHVAYFSPFVFGQSYKQKYDALPWSYATKKFTAWCEGKTGFPIVDAGMRQLNATGWMHNRVRLIVASFLTKDLHIDWRWGERYFAQQLIDYDPAVNNGNWQWSASTGCDAQPYFRIFNPWLQQKKFDPDCVYIKKWVKELKHVSTKDIHAYYKPAKTITDYPRPIVEHALQAERAKAMFKKIG